MKYLLLIIAITFSSLSMAEVSQDELLKAAKQGNVTAMYELGKKHALIYELFPDADDESRDKALYWFEKAAKRGHKASQVKVGGMNQQYGEYEKAIYWYNKAAKQGNIYAQKQLGILYCDKKGGAKNRDKGSYWFTKAAEQGDISTQLMLVKLYQTGMCGVQVNLKKRFYWLNKAGERYKRQLTSTWLSILFC